MSTVTAFPKLAPAPADAPTPVGRLPPEAIAWLAAGAAAADELTGPEQVIWIALRPDGFVVHGVRGQANAVRPVPLALAGKFGDTNLLLAAVLAVSRELNTLKATRAPSRWRGGAGRGGRR